MSTKTRISYWYGRCPEGHEHWHDPLKIGESLPPACLHADCHEQIEWKRR